MKRKFFNLITVSLASLILLAPTQGAFGFGSQPQATLKEEQPFGNDTGDSLDASSKGIHNQGLMQERKATQTKQIHPTHPTTVVSQTPDPRQPSSVEPTAQVSSTSNTVEGLFVTFLFISYILVGLQYRKYRAHRATVLLQQIETLERIWKMKPQQR